MIALPRAFMELEKRERPGCKELTECKGMVYCSFCRKLGNRELLNRGNGLGKE